MTDKQILIHDVNVSGCSYWKGYCRIASLCDYAGHLCEVNPNCHYKKWQRKEQECEKLRNHIVSFDYLEALSNEQVASLYTATIDELAIRGFKAKYNTEVSLLTRYKQALTEIKELLLRTATDSQEHCVNAKSVILQKCEVLDDK